MCAPLQRHSLFPNPVLYGLLAVSIVTNVILIERTVKMDWHRVVHRAQAVPAVTSADHVRGPATARLTIIEYSDFECPFCARFHAVLKQTLGERADVRWVYRHFPLADLHPLAARAAEASECAAAQGRFWDYADAPFERQASLDERVFLQTARGLGMDEPQLAACLASGATRARVSADAKAFDEGHIAGTPTFFLNGSRTAGALPYEDLKKALDAAGDRRASIE